MLQRVVAAGGDVEEIHSLVREERCETYGVFGSPRLRNGLLAASSSQSVAEIRRKSGMSLGIWARVCSTSSSVRRVRFSNEPPYLSVRVLETGERKE